MADVKKECLTNAEIAFNNKRYMEALAWYKKALEVAPEDTYALSRAGAICVSMGNFKDALTFFERAKKADPENGDNVFNYGNACFFNEDHVGAFAAYVEAEKLGVSEDVKPRMFYQMALLCSLRSDLKSALLYFRKCEESDKSGVLSLNPDLIAEKLKLYMLLGDYTNAERCAAQLVAINPTDFRSYMVYFSLLMAHKNYDGGEKLLQDALRYATLNESDRFNLLMQMAALYSAKGEHEKAVALLERRKTVGGLSGEQLSQLLLALAEAHIKALRCDTAAEILNSMLNGKAYLPPVKKAEPVKAHHGELTEEELEAMIAEDIAEVRELTDYGVAYPEPGYDDEGNWGYFFEEDLFAAPAAAEEEAASEPAVPYKLQKEFREKADFLLLTCYLEQDKFAEVQKQANVLKNSDNKYYQYYGIYTDAMAERKLYGGTKSAERKYAQAIAFFRNKTFADAKDTLACLFRARLYAEQGSYDKAVEIANLLGDEDREAVMKYIESCKA